MKRTIRSSSTCLNGDIDEQSPSRGKSDLSGNDLMVVLRLLFFSVVRRLATGRRLELERTSANIDAPSRNLSSAPGRLESEALGQTCFQTCSFLVIRHGSTTDGSQSSLTKNISLVINKISL
jgi:hypothetical protein